MPRSHPLLVQLARVWRLSGRWLPNGWLDAIRQLALFAGAYYLYRIVRGIVDGQAGLAFENARHLVDAERALGLFFEPGLRRGPRAGVDHHVLQLDVRELALRDHHDVPDLAVHRAQPRLLLRPQHVHGCDGLALVGCIAYPTAPPRFLPEWGFSDSVASFVGENAEQSANVLYNPFAAVPSMHVAFALMIAVPAIMLVKHRALKVLWAIYPLS